MSSDQPRKKKLRRADEVVAGTDQPDYIQNDLSALHLDVNALNGPHLFFHAGTDTPKDAYSNDSDSSDSSSSTPPPPEASSVVESKNAANASNLVLRGYDSSLVISPESDDTLFTQDTEVGSSNFDVFEAALIKQCLCGIPESVLRRPLDGYLMYDCHGKQNLELVKMPLERTLRFLSNLELLFNVYLKQNNKGCLCSRIVDICNSLVRDEYNLMEQVITLSDTRNKFVIYLIVRILSSFLIIAKTNVNSEWLETLFSFLSFEDVDYIKMNMSLEIIKRVVDWKDIEIHVLEESNLSARPETACVTIQYSDSESFDTSSIKGLIIKSLETKWPDLIGKVQHLITNSNNVQTQMCILNFFSLWESTISVKANLSVIDTKPFYAYLESFVWLLSNTLPPIIWKQLLSLFNEVLCYGSTLALQDMLPDDTCQLAYLIVRHVKDSRLLDSLPYR